MNLWTNTGAVEATGGEAKGGAWNAARVEIDSRRIKPGDLFVALKGDTFDGHEFVQKAFAAGAVAAMVNTIPAGAKGNFVVVPDTQKGLEALAAYNRACTKAKIIGLTGSVGKTSTKEMLKLALEPHGAVFASHGNFNNHIGVPLNLANLPPDADFAVFEMGMNHAGEISQLTKMVRPHIAIITGVDAVHLEFFKSVEAIADAKAEIFEGIEPHGIAILNADNAQFERLKKAAAKHNISPIIACGAHRNAQCRLVEYHANACGSSIAAEIFDKEISYVLGSVGKHWAVTSLFALAVAHALRLDESASAQALAAFCEPEGRGQVLRLPMANGELLLIDDSYNASPVSMRAAFAKTAEIWEGAGKQGRKIAALGDMLELGQESEAMHAALAKDLQQCGFDLVFTAGNAMRALHRLYPNGQHADTAKGLLPILAKTVRAGDVLLIKGSHGSKMYELVAALQVKEKAHAV
jgi:UDP-N-acetylmuramoyl-tripeptide--D-alanyl-D-alanine ligase